MKPINLRIAEELGVREQQVSAAISLLDGGATVPFVARYRKEVTGALDDAQLRTLESGYYEVYNQPNVKLVDINETPIERITPTGIKTSEAEYEFDIIIYATGFDAITGSF